MISRLERLQRAVGLKGGRFRRTGFRGGDIVLGTFVGILSGKYIFEEPLRHYWAEKHAEEAAAKAALEGTGTFSGGGSAAGAGGGSKQ